jgi:hypothetical protein
MARLVAFGCSFTLGAGLESQDQAYPYVLSGLLDRQCVNKGIGGASNKEIWNALVNFRFKKDDWVFVNWTFTHRNYFNGQQYLICDDQTEDEEFYYKKLYNRKDAKDDWIVRMNHAGSYLQSKGIPLYNTVIERNMARWLPRYNTQKILHAHWEKYQHKYPKALDVSHPGPLAHAAFAQRVFELI